MKLKELPKISDAEWQVMKVLWNESPLAASEIITALKPEADWSPKTIHTLISRLVKKEALEVKKNCSFYLYSPLVSEEECKKEEGKSFLQKVYNGSVHLMVSNFLKQEALTSEEIEALQRILDAKKK